VNATSGTTPYTYKWSTTPQQTGQTANNIPAGNYTVTVTDSKGCSVTGNTTVPDTPGPTANAVSATDKCGQGIGSATATGSGGTGGFTYKWNTNPVQTTQTATNLKAGNYTVTLTDSKNCSAAASTTVGDTPGPTASAVSVADTCTLGVGTATANPSGGTGPYTYKWSTTPQQTTQKATGLKSGNYTVTVSDNNSCTAIAQVTVNNIGGPTVSITYTDARCTNDNGTASVTASGGNPPYTYVWSNGANTSSISNLSADTYTVSVYDKGSCPPFTGTAVIKNIAPPVITKMEVTDATCGNNNGAINVTISAGTSPFTYKWSSGQTTQNLTNLAAGDYTITVTDKTPCSTNGTATVKSVGGPQLTTAKTDENCGKKDGTATVTATGGTGNFTYLWNTVPPQTTATASNLSAGTYRVTVSDGGPCPAIATVQIINIPGPMATVNVTDAHCFQSDGSASLNVTGGSGNYTYSWNTNPPNSTSEISAVPPGIYVVTVSDGKCTLILSADIKNISGPKANFTYSPSIVSSSNPVCQFTDQSTGSPVKWHWDFGDGTEPSGEQNPNHRYSSTDTFYVKLVVANQFNCKDSIVRIVWVKEDFKVYIPDAFTPNNDHLNDVFGIKGQAIDTRNYEMRIYDRWGNQIFYSNNINIKWDGSFNNKLVPQDTYTYRILVGELGGPTHTYLGSVMVIR
jgi:gliding motility-associated-like protein